MGCIVNGPGEMADADFGYVGGAPGKIDLYVGKEVVQRGIPMDSVSFLLFRIRKRLPKGSQQPRPAPRWTTTTTEVRYVVVLIV
jgi:(E)-4-hydroxy-3-methylbut-2-enyl-diphosphate synthase